MNKQKVLVFEAYPFFSGSQRITLNLCRILKEKGFFITLLLVDDRFNNHTTNFKDFVDEITFINTNPILLKYGDEESWFSKKTFFKAIFLGLFPFYLLSLKKILFKKYDFLYCCDPRGAMMMFFGALFFRGKSILHFHGKNRLPSFLSRLFLFSFNDVICVSNDVKKSLPISKKKEVIHNGIDFSQYEDVFSSDIDIKKIINDLEKNHENKRLIKYLYAGLMRPHKGVHHLIKDFVKLINSVDTSEKIPVLFLCGEAKTKEEKEFKKTLIKYCRDNNVEKHVFWLGWRNDVLLWMKNVNFFVFPTINKEENHFEGFGNYIESTEGLPTVLIESSICNLFNIVSQVTGVNEIITEGKNGILFDYKDSDSLYYSLLSCFENEFEFKEFDSRELFSLQTFQNKIVTLFK
jgi:glycosyltransferase involved in cell wall biosynthesis